MKQWEREWVRFREFRHAAHKERVERWLEAREQLTESLRGEHPTTAIKVVRQAPPFPKYEEPSFAQFMDWLVQPGPEVKPYRTVIEYKE